MSHLIIYSAHVIMLGYHTLSVDLLICNYCEQLMYSFMRFCEHAVVPHLSRVCMHVVLQRLHILS